MCCEREREKLEDNIGSGNQLNPQVSLRVRRVRQKFGFGSGSTKLRTPIPGRISSPPMPKRDSGCGFEREKRKAAPLGGAGGAIYRGGLAVPLHRSTVSQERHHFLVSGFARCLGGGYGDEAGARDGGEADCPSYSGYLDTAAPLSFSLFAACWKAGARRHFHSRPPCSTECTATSPNPVVRCPLPRCLSRPRWAIKVTPHPTLK